MKAKLKRPNTYLTTFMPDEAMADLIEFNAD